MKKLLMGKASGITTAIDAMAANERGVLPSAAYGEDYNRLRDATIEAFPMLGPLMPPQVGRHRDLDRTDARFSEIRSFAEQIFQILGGLDD